MSRCLIENFDSYDDWQKEAILCGRPDTPETLTEINQAEIRSHRKSSLSTIEECWENDVVQRWKDETIRQHHPSQYYVKKLWKYSGAFLGPRTILLYPLWRVIAYGPYLFPDMAEWFLERDHFEDVAFSVSPTPDDESMMIRPHGDSKQRMVILTFHDPQTMIEFKLRWIGASG